MLITELCVRTVIANHETLLRSSPDMRFTCSNCSDFEIPTTVVHAGMDRFARMYPTPMSSRPHSFIRSSSHAGALVKIEPVHRAVALDFGGFDRARMVRILQGFVAGDAIEPVPLNMIDKAAYRFAVYDASTASTRR